MAIPLPGAVPITVDPLRELLTDRRYVSAYSVAPFAFEVRVAGQPMDPDGQEVLVSFDGAQNPPGNIFQRAATRDDLGTYSITLSSIETSTPGLYQMTWIYEMDGVAQRFVGHVEIGEPSAAFDSLSEGFRGIVESAYVRFADLFDSPYGGPHLQVYFQSNFNRGRMAQLLNIAVQRLNTIAQPRMTYSLDETTNTFPFEQWGGLLDQALYIECLKHLVRSYVEQPNVQGVSVARLDRRDYMNRWQSVLDAEQRDFNDAVEVFKIAHMGLGRPRVLVSGGAYGKFGPTRLPGAPAHPRVWARNY